jgi:tetratricopeptide (TPR) repeat protein/transglutaminase-like putative cysteine protease
VFSFLLAAAAFSLPAQQPVEPWKAEHFSIPAKDLYAAASAVTAPDGANAVILEDDENFTFDDAGRMLHSGYFVYRILTEKGAEGWDSLSVGWEPWHQARPEIRVRVITPDFAEHQLDPKTITEAPAQGGDYKTYSDGKRLHAPFPAISQGVVVEEEYVERETEPLFAAGRAGWTVFGHERVPVAHSRVEFDAPSALPLHTGTLGQADMQPVRVQSDGRVKITYDMGRMEGIDPSESYLPPDAARYPQIRFSTAASWQSIASEYGKIVDSRATPAAVQAIVDQITAGKSSVAEKEAALLDYLDREVRYTGIEFGGAAIIPHEPAETLAKKYGDCKDKATLLVTMLRAAGIPAYVAMLNAGEPMDVPDAFPGMGVFNHAIVYVPGTPAAKKNKQAVPDLWIDATDRYARMGQLPIADQGRLALIARAETTGLQKIPEAPSKENLLFETRVLTLSENGPASLVETTRPMGVYESRYRSYYADKPDKEVKDGLTTYVKGQYVAEKLGSVDRSDPADLSRQFELTITAEKARRGYTDLSNASAAIRLDALFYRLPDDLRQKDDPEKKKKEQDKDQPEKPRTQDWELDESFTTEWNCRVVPPPGFVPKELPRDVSIAIGPALLTENFTTEKNGVVVAHIVFDSVKRRYTVAEATELRNKVADLIAGPAIMINFEPEGEVLLHEGKVREALASYRSLVTLHPNEAVHHLQVAKVLLEAGMGEAARAEARQAVKLEPASAMAQKILAQILRRDLVGRPMRAGSDLNGAAEAYRAAIKLDPDDHSIQGDLAIMLEYDPVGRRYGGRAKMKEAIAEYEALGQDKLVELGLTNNLAYARFYGGDYAGALKAAQALNPEPKPLMAAAVGALQGSKAGLAEANKHANDENGYKETARTAGEMLMNMRQYALAADFLEAGASGDNAAQTMGLASMLRGAQKHEDLHFENTPAGLAKRFYLMGIEEDQTEAKLDAVLSRNARKVMQAEDPEVRKRALGMGKQVDSQLARQGSSFDVAIDTIARVFDPKIEGDDGLGYREKVQIPGSRDSTFFVVKEDGQYRFLDDTGRPNSIALEMLDRIQAGDLKGAKALLDWLREDSHLEGGDDPLGGAVFPRFWTKGQAADARKMKLAAAAILVTTKPTVAAGVPILEDALKDAVGEREKTNIRLGLQVGYELQENFPRLLEVSTALMELEPLSFRAFLGRVTALTALKRHDEAMALADERLKQLEGDPDAFRAKMRIEVDRGNYAAARTWSRKLIDQGKQDADLLNSTAWFALFTGKVEDQDISDAIKSTQLAKDNPNILHTLACLYAEVGKTKEAYDLLLRGMDEANLDEPSDVYWYAFGRIAEQYGEREIAIADYRRLEKPKEAMTIPGSTYLLAQMRLRALGAAAGVAAK